MTMLTPQEIEGLKRGIYAGAANVGAYIVATFVPPFSDALAWTTHDWLTVLKTCAVLFIVGVAKLWFSGKKDADRARAVVEQAAAGAPLTALKSSDVGAAVIDMGQAPPPQ
jgi:nitrate/nitrite transporter NarK